MKNLFLTSLLSILSPLLMAQLFHQPQHFPDLHPDSVMRQNPRFAHMMYEPGEVIVRFEDDMIVNVFKADGTVRLGVENLDKIFEEFQVTDIQQLFKGMKKHDTRRTITAYNGQTFEVPSLHNIFLLNLKSSTDPYEHAQLIEQLNGSKNIVYAEPNYIQTITGSNAVSPVLNQLEMQEWVKEKLPKDSNRNANTYVPNDPLFPQQWYIPVVGVDLIWDSINGNDTTQIVAVLDTGVDWEHPDLQNKIWENPEEIPGNGIDDDGNGKVDDIIGWDWINNDNNPLDDNSHGTHVAGIVAAETDNGIGISGVSLGARIMPLKVFQSSGRGNTADITQGIIYATQKGATVINMSFGTYARSFLMEDALINAYANTILVAAAGNDGLYLEQCFPAGPFYPAALSYVLGVQAPDGSFSNVDCNGPTFSAHPELYNYEMKAPGTSIISTIPNGNYRVYQGTSMAAPILSGALAMYRPLRADESMELMWVKLIQTTDTFFDIFEALTIVPVPEVRMLSQTLIDTLNGGDDDGRPDAGETIQIWFTARNTGGFCDSTWFKIRFHEFEDTTTAVINKSTSYIGTMSPYASRNSETDPMTITFNENVAHDRDICFDLLSWYSGSEDTLVQDIIFTIENGEELIGVMDSTKTLFPNRLYILRNSFKVGSNGLLTIRPGAKILVYSGYTIPVNGRVIANGTPDSLIQFTGYGSGAGTVFSFRNNLPIRNNFSFCRFENLYWPLSSDNYMNPASVYNSIFIDVNNIGVVDSIINNLYYSNDAAIYSSRSGYVSNNNFISKNSSLIFPSYGPNFYKQNNFINFRMPPMGYTNTNLELKNNWINKKNAGYIYETSYQSIADYQYIQHQYWGTSDSAKIENMIYDFMENAMRPRAVFTPFETSAIDSCHAVVWKVLVNGSDAYDEYVEPVGVGPQRFDVYFNREMDTTFTPQLTFGVRFPYTQQLVTDSAGWDSTQMIFTAYKNMQIYTGDGINRIRVANARDLEGWEIPVEDMRFEFLINAAGSASIDFIATPGIGKVDLEWHEPDDLPTLLGYNMYRFHHLTDTTFSDTLLVNNALIIDTLFTDFDVLPQQMYYYLYRIVRTDFAESDYSQVVNATVLTASVGDANGDMSVNILDITSIVSYILNGNPQPFIFDAADVNADDQINLLDVIGVVNIIMNGSKSGLISQPGYIYLKPDEIELSSDGTLAGIQFKLVGKNIAALELKSQLKGFEFVRYISGDTLTGMLFNMHNNSIPQGRIKLFDIKQHPGTLGWGDVFGGNTSGRYVAIFKDEDVLPVDHRYSFNVHPNPAKNLMFTDIQLPSTGEVSLHLYDMYGRSIILKDKAILEGGRHHFRFDKQQLSLVKGLYILQLHVRPIDKSELPFRKELKLVVM